MKEKEKKLYLFGGVLVLIFIALIGYRAWSEKQPSQHDAFAQCIAETDTTFFGASWCPHCKSQKEMFGTAEQYLPYVECSRGPTSASGQTEECNAEGVESYPTWDFGGVRAPGVLSLEQLSEATGCNLDGTRAEAQPPIQVEADIATSTLELGTVQSEASVE